MMGLIRQLIVMINDLPGTLYIQSLTFVILLIRDRKMLLDRRAKGKQQAEKGKHSEESVAMET